ncbi:hypothetical protein L596_014804 [Steinernema carpocapsae]|uniref:Uncharacterized protein n=1 Tax=Steinernema carpocapsae TaxID=34508 RepID=A0A4U5NDV1_STECR|nr:hypothetical protein L596_014804 [Steinernema carpocapsae]
MNSYTAAEHLAALHGPFEQSAFVLLRELHELQNAVEGGRELTVNEVDNGPVAEMQNLQVLHDEDLQIDGNAITQDRTAADGAAENFTEQINDDAVGGVRRTNRKHVPTNCLYCKE